MAVRYLCFQADFVRTTCNLNTLNNDSFDNWVYTEASRHKVGITSGYIMYLVGVTCQQDTLTDNVNN